MTRIVTRMMAAAAALGLVAAPIMAQANTRAADNGATYSNSNSLPGLGRAANGEGQEEAGLGFAEVGIGLVAVTAIVGGVVTYAESQEDDDCTSPDAC